MIPNNGKHVAIVVLAPYSIEGRFGFLKFRNRGLTQPEPTPMREAGPRYVHLLDWELHVVRCSISPRRFLAALSYFKPNVPLPTAIPFMLI